MITKFEAFKKMNEYELEFCHELKTKDIILLRDIKLSKEHLEEITIYIRLLFKVRETKALEKSFPLTTSLYLVWTAVYQYKDGDFWGVIFHNLSIPNRHKYQRILGEIFLKTITKYNLLSIDNSGSKKYLSPILMHGYISNHYANSFLDYLNKVYTVLLKYDVSESNIDAIWDDVFDVKSDNKSLEKDIKEVKDKISQLIEKRTSYDISIDLLTIDKKNLEKQEKHVDELYKQISSRELEIEIYKSELYELKEVLENIEKLQSSIEKISGVQSSIVNSESLHDTFGLVTDIRTELNLHIEYNELVIKDINKIIKKTRNTVTIEEDKIKVTNMDIASLGKGNLEEGWNIIQECNEIDIELDRLNKKLKSKEELIEISQGIQNSSLKQILTTSLNHLYKQDSHYFREFIIETFQAIDAVSRGENFNTEYPLYDTVIEWNDNAKVKIINTNINFANRKLENKTTYEIINEGKEKEVNNRLQLQSLTKPFIRLDTNNWDILLEIPFQTFTYIKNTDIRPKYTLEGLFGNKVYIDTQSYTKGEIIQINQASLPIQKYDEYTFIFEYFNLKETYAIDLNSIMIFNNCGQLLSNNKLVNGLYYVVCNNDWHSCFKGILDIYPSGLDGFNVYEIQMNEDKAIFKSSNNSIIEFIGSNFSQASLEGLNIVEGITIDGIKISTGELPELLVSLRDINPTDNTLRVYLDDGLILERTIEDLMDTKLVEKEDLTLRVDLKKVSGKNWKELILKLKIVLLNKNRDEVFSEEFWSILKTKFSYRSQDLIVRIPLSSRIRYKDKSYSNREFTIPLISESGESFSIFYNTVGWKSFKVEVPIVKAIFKDNQGNIVDIQKDLLVSQLATLRNLYIVWKSNSSIPKTIYLYDNEKNLESRIHFKKNIASANLFPYYDILKSTNTDSSLKFHWTGGNRNVESENIINVFKQWKVDDIDCYSKEEEDEYIIELKYNYNFDFQSKKFLEVYNEHTLIFKKELRDKAMIIYIKKKDIKSLDINIKIVCFEETNDIFGKTINEIIAGEHNLELTSRINNLDLIKKHGILATGFKYRGESNDFKTPFKIKKIKKTNPINFIQEELYIGQAIIKSQPTEVLFYLNLENNKLPFLLDLDRDGAQYDPRTGDVFWENRSGKEIMGPIDDIKYLIKEE